MPVMISLARGTSENRPTPARLPLAPAGSGGLALARGRLRWRACPGVAWGGVRRGGARDRGSVSVRGLLGPVALAACAAAASAPAGMRYALLHHRRRQRKE